MKEYVYEGKDQDVVLKKVLEDLNVTENDFVYTNSDFKVVEGNSWLSGKGVELDLKKSYYKILANVRAYYEAKQK